MYGIYYNELFDSLIVSKKTETDFLIEIRDDITFLKKGDEVIGANLFNVSKNLHITKAFNSFDPKVIEYLKTHLKPILMFSQESQFVVGKVLKCEVIEGTHLHVCEVDVKTKVLQIVCGAKNIEKDQLVVVALPYAWMPNGKQIIPGKLRGFDSNGMICSAKELAIKDKQFNKEGIIVLSPDANFLVGDDFYKNLN